jgi:Tfp pilus assembly protein PilO
VSRRTMVGAGVALVVVVLAWYMLLWGPQGGRADDADARREVAAGTNMGLEANVARLQAGQAALPGLQADLETLRSAVPDTPNLAQFILDANDAATASGVDFLSIAPTPPAANADPLLSPAVGLNISVNGGYFQVRDYLNRLNDLPRLVVVDTVALTPGETASGALRLAASLSARMFTTTLPLTPAEAAATAAGAPGTPSQPPVSAVPTANSATPVTVPVTAVPAGAGP